jgi:hypothetical protein
VATTIGTHREPGHAAPPDGFLSPRAHQALAPRGINRIASLEGVTLGLLCNSKPNAQVLLDAVANGIATRFQLAGVVRDRKASPSEPAPAEVYSNLASRCGAIIFATAD